MLRHRSPILILVSCLSVFGCSYSMRVTTTQRSSIEQKLLVRSLERALAGIDLTRLAGRRLTLELFALTADQWFAKEFVTAKLESYGTQVVSSRDSADMHLKIFVSVFGVDSGETLLGLPSFPAPLVGVTVPEIAFFKWIRNRGNAEVEIYLYDGHTNAFLEKPPVGVGRSKYDEYTMLLLISFSVDDLDRRGRGSEAP